MTHKIKVVDVEKYAYYVNKPCQNVDLEIWLWRQIVTSQTAHTKYKWLPYTTEWKPPWKICAYTTAARCYFILLTIVFCRVFCAFYDIISPKLSLLLHGFLNSRAALFHTVTHTLSLYGQLLLKTSFLVRCSVLPPSVTLYSDLLRHWSENTSQLN